jgi:hypothetical protein
VTLAEQTRKAKPTDAPPFAEAVKVGAVWMTPAEACERICGDRRGRDHAEGCPYTWPPPNPTGVVWRAEKPATVPHACGEPVAVVKRDTRYVAVWWHATCREWSDAQNPDFAVDIMAAWAASEAERGAVAMHAVCVAAAKDTDNEPPPDSDGEGGWVGPSADDVRSYIVRAIEGLRWPL